MFEKYLKVKQDPEDMRRFKYKAVVNGSYYNDTSNYEVRFLIEDIDIINGTSYVGISKNNLMKQVIYLFNNLNQENIKQIVDNIVLNSYSSDDYVAITPNYIIQATGLFDNKNCLVYEGDIIKDDIGTSYAVVYDSSNSLRLENMKVPDTFITFDDIQEFEIIGNVFQGIGSVI